MPRLAPSLALLSALVLAGPTRAGEAAADPEIQSVITAQIEAFNAGDAVRAESFAAPGIKALFPEPSGFLGMVRKGYAPLIHPRSTRFEPTVTAGSATVQHVTVVDAEGVVWTAVYTLERVDGRWAIAGCVLVKSPDTTA